jgi:hypothetical protein
MGKTMGPFCNPEDFKISRLDKIRAFRVEICGLKSNIKRLVDVTYTFTF